VMSNIPIAPLTKGELWPGTDFLKQAISEFKRFIVSSKSTGGFILRSLCGLYRGKILKRIKTLYRIADEAAINICGNALI
jgi:hypothetical protein